MERSPPAIGDDENTPRAKKITCAMMVSPYSYNHINSLSLERAQIDAVTAGYASRRRASQHSSVDLSAESGDGDVAEKSHDIVINSTVGTS